MIEKISHYTNYETLDCILSNKSLRFSRLDSLNDIYEQHISNIGYFNKMEIYSTFVSCFSTDEESIPLWCLYARSKEKGLTLSEAIKFGIQLRFDKENLKEFLSSKNLNARSEYGTYVKLYDIDESISSEINITRTYLDSVIYSDKESFLEKSGYFVMDEIILDSQYIGRIKPSAWSYEKEVRGILRVKFDEIQFEPKDHSRYYDADLGADLLKSVQIVLNPFISSNEFENKKIEILNKYHFIEENQIIRSDLYGCITF